MQFCLQNAHFDNELHGIQTLKKITSIGNMLNLQNSPINTENLSDLEFTYLNIL